MPNPGAERADRIVTELSDTLLRSAIGAAPDGFIAVDSSGTIIFANPIAAEMFDYSADALMGMRIEALLPEAARTKHVDHRAGFMHHPRTRAMGSGLDLWARRRSGETFPVEISLIPVAEGDALYVIAIVRDVTQRRLATRELMEAHEQLALVDDRERIARDLHDTVIQRLFAVGLSLQGALSGILDEKTAARVEAAVDEIDGTIRDIRTAIFSLHARRMPTSGLRDDVLATAREAGRALGFEPHVAFTGPVDAATTDAAREHLVPTLREALSNVVRHANATKVEVVVAVSNDAVVLTVSDNGVGIAAGAHGGRGFGNMTERATTLGGQCDVEAAAAGGTVVTWRVPIKGS
jgi:PAS domain S-box-containing protein